MMQLPRRHWAGRAAWFSLMVLSGLGACSDDTATDAAVDTGTPDGSEGDADERTDTLMDAPMDTTEAERCPEDYYVVVGTDGDDVLEGTDGPDCIVGLAGDDTLRGFGGDDLLFGGEGADRLEGGEGADELDGGEGCDVLTALGSNNTLSGGGGNDVLSGGQSPALLDAGEGDDWVSFEGNAARVLGGEGVDRCAVPTGGTADGPTADEIEGCEAPMAPLCGTESDCSFGVCTAGSCVVSDYCGRRYALEDETCDGFDDDCDGVSDEGYASSDSSCGEGACAAEGRRTCEMGSDGMVREQDSCMPGMAAASDASCDGVDDDCDGRVDEDFALRCDGAGVVSCDEGVEVRADCDDGSACTGIESCVDGACTRGVPLTTPECACEVGTCPEDPYPLAPSLPSDGHSPEFAETVRFLVDGPAAVQMGVAVDELNDARLARLYGRVITTDGSPFGSCRVSVLGHPEMGFTFTREDGAYDLLVNGGGHLVHGIVSPFRVSLA